MANKKAYYRKKADRLFQQYMTSKNSYCEMCSKPISCHHHFHPKASSSRLRYVEENMIPVCAGCHLSFHSNRSAEITSRLIAKKGIKWSNDLVVKKREFIKSDTIGYYKEIIEKLMTGAIYKASFDK